MRRERISVTIILFEPYFKLLSEKYNEKIFRVELVYLAKNITKEEITNLSNVPVHFQF